MLDNRSARLTEEQGTGVTTNCKLLMQQKQREKNTEDHEDGKEEAVSQATAVANVASLHSAVTEVCVNCMAFPN